MSAVGKVIFSALSADSAVGAIAGDRIMPNTLLQGSVLPAVVYQVVTQLPQPSFDGSPASRLSQCRIQVDCYARKYLDAQALADAVHAVLGALSTPAASAWLDSQRDLYDNDTQYHRVSMDFSVWA